MVCAALLAHWLRGPGPPSTPTTVQVARGDSAWSAQQLPESLPGKQEFRWRVESDSPAQNADIDALVAALADAHANVRQDAVSDLGLLQDARAESLLAITALQDPEASVRAEALYYLGASRAESQLATLQLALADPDRDIRKAAIGALQDIGGAGSAQILGTALGDANPAIRTAAAEALSEIDAEVQAQQR